MSETQDTGGAAVEPTTERAQLVDIEAEYRPKPEPRETYGEGRAERDRAYDRERPRKRGPDITVWEDKAEDKDKPLSIDGATKKLVGGRQMKEALELADRTGAPDHVAGAAVRHLENQRYGYHDENGRWVPPGTLTRAYADPKAQPDARQASRDLTQARTETDPTEIAESRQAFDDLSAYAKQILAEQSGQQATEAVTEPAPPAEPQVDPVAQARQRAEYEAAAYAHLRQSSQAEIILDARLGEIRQSIETEFSDCKNMNDVAGLSPERQARWHEWQKSFAAHATQLQQVALQRQQTELVINQARENEFRQWKSNQDRIAADAIPEINDEKQGHAFRTAAHEILDTYLGINEKTAGNVPPELKRALNFSGTQRLIADAVRWRLAQAKAAEVSATNLPPVPQRPGVSQTKANRASANVEQFMQRGDRSSPGSQKQLRNYAAALAASRKART